MVDDAHSGSASEAPAPDAMTIHQLAERSGVPPRRIRFYVASDLLPGPIGRGRAAYYRQAHLTRLQQIQALRAVNLSLEEIRERLGDPEPAFAEETAPESTWRRWEIAPGVELHARANLDPEIATIARILAGVARGLLAERTSESRSQ